MLVALRPWGTALIILSSIYAESVRIIRRLCGGRERRLRASLDRRRLQRVVDQSGHTSGVVYAPDHAWNSFRRGRVPLFCCYLDSVGPMAKCTEDLVDLLNVMVDKSHPRVPRAGYSQKSMRQWKDISIAYLDPHHWRLNEEVQKPQPGALDQIVSLTRP